MKIVDRNTFLKIADRVIFQKVRYSDDVNQDFGPIQIKIGNLDDNDFISVDVGNMWDVPDRVGYPSKYTDEQLSKNDYRINMSSSRDSLQEEDIYFAVWDKADVTVFLGEVKDNLGI